MDETDPVHRSRFRAAGDEIDLRESVDDEDGVFELRMPIASTGAVRNDGDEPLTRSEIRGMAEQIAERSIGVFPAHGGDTMIAAGRYSPFEKLGEWTDAGLETRTREEGDDDTVLMATARMLNPRDLPAATGKYREGLAILKEQAKAGISQDASIGWRDDESFPGGVDLMEASIVGIGADWRTNTADDNAEVVARSAIEAGADPDALVDAVRDAVRSDPDDARPFGPPGDPNRWEDFDECVAEVEDWEGIDDEEAYCGWAKSQTEGQSAESTANAEDSDVSMTDTDDPDAGTETDEEQTADDGETTEREPDDVSPEDLARLVAASYEGVDAGDLVEALGEMGEYMGGVDLDALADLVSIVTDADDDAVMSAMEDLMGGDSEEQEGDKPDDYDEDEEDDDEETNEQDADTDDTEERDADGEAADADLRDAVESLREELDELRSGGLDADDVETPDADTEQDADDGETDTRESEGGSGFDNLGDYNN